MHSSNFQFYYSLMIANGLDFTRQFAWINNDERRVQMLALDDHTTDNFTSMSPLK